MPNGSVNNSIKRQIGLSSGIPPHMGAAIVVLYLLMYDYGGQLLRFDFAAVVQRVCFLAVVLTVLVAIMGLPLSETIGRLGIPSRGHLKFVALALVVGIAIRLTLKFAAQSIVHGTDMRTLTAWNFVYECIIPPLNEEPIFRGLILMSILSIFQTRWVTGVVLAALIFCSVHNVHDPEQQIATFILGCLLGVVFVRTRSLSSCIVLHAVWNMMIFVRLPYA